MHARKGQSLATHGRLISSPVGSLLGLPRIQSRSVRSGAVTHTPRGVVRGSLTASECRTPKVGATLYKELQEPARLQAEAVARRVAARDAVKNARFTRTGRKRLRRRRKDKGFEAGPLGSESSTTIPNPDEVVSFPNVLARNTELAQPMSSELFEHDVLKLPLLKAVGTPSCQSADESHESSDPRREVLEGHDCTVADAFAHARMARLNAAFERNSRGNGCLSAEDIFDALADAGLEETSCNEFQVQSCEHTLDLHSFNEIACKVRLKVYEHLWNRLPHGFKYGPALGQSDAVQVILGLGAAVGSPCESKVRAALPKGTSKPRIVVDIAVELREASAALRRQREANIAHECGLHGDELERLRRDLVELRDAFASLDDGRGCLSREHVELWLMRVGAPVSVVDFDTMGFGSFLIFRQCLRVLQGLRDAEAAAIKVRLRSSGRRDGVRAGCMPSPDAGKNAQLLAKIGVVPRTRAEQAEVAAVFEDAQKLQHREEHAVLAQHAAERIRCHRRRSGAEEALRFGFDQEAYLQIVRRLSRVGERANIAGTIETICGTDAATLSEVLEGLPVDAEQLAVEGKRRGLASISAGDLVALLSWQEAMVNTRSATSTEEE